jgi:hypothetical protein
MKRGRKAITDPSEIAKSLRNTSINNALKKFGTIENVKKFMPELFPVEVADQPQTENSNLSKKASKTDDSSEENENQIKIMKTHWFLVEINRSHPLKNILCLYSLKKGIYLNFN